MASLRWVNQESRPGHVRKALRHALAAKVEDTAGHHGAGVQH